MTSRGLTICYMLALAVIAILSIGSHALLGYALRVNEGSALVINESGRQRMLTQKIVAAALMVDRGDEGASATLDTTLNRYTAAHRRLVDAAKSGSDKSPVRAELATLYFGPAALDAQVNRFASAARRVVERPGRPLPADLDRMIAASQGKLASGLDAVVAIHQRESERRSRAVEAFQWIILAVVLLTLALEALFIFKPMVRRIAAYVRQLLQTADHDYLTGVANRRAFTARAIAEIERARRGDDLATLLLIDADHFKCINDAHGHPAGDAVLVALATLLSGAARPQDIVARIGGEEFVMLLPGANLSQAASVAERIRAAVADSPLQTPEATVELTVSIGLAAVALDQPHALDAALRVADRMLYHAKDAGRNAVWPRLQSIGDRAAA